MCPTPGATANPAEVIITESPASRSISVTYHSTRRVMPAAGAVVPQEPIRKMSWNTAQLADRCSPRVGGSGDVEMPVLRGGVSR